MRFPEWAEKQGRGVLKRIEHRYGIGYMTLQRLRAGKTVSARTAALVVEATGGECTLEELIFPEPAEERPGSERPPIPPTPPGVAALAEQTPEERAAMPVLVEATRKAHPSTPPPAAEPEGSAA